jgi:hypothetical protein
MDKLELKDDEDIDYTVGLTVKDGCLIKSETPIHQF